MQSFKMAIKSIMGNKLRAVLTMVGIIIGVMALVILVSFVDGATTSVTDTVSSLGNDLLTVSISDDKNQPVKLSDLTEWSNVEKIGYIAPVVDEQFTAKYGTTSSTVNVYGTTASYMDVEEITMLLGRFIKTTDVDNNNTICVLSEDAATELVGYKDCLGDEISINGMKYTVVGIIQKDEESLTSAFNSSSLEVYIPYTSFVRLSDSATLKIDSFYVSQADGATVEETETAITEILMERFEEDDAFTVKSSNAMESAMTSITSMLKILLGGIAAISLVVGGIGIMNIMLVTVTERTKEIGIRKAIGATRGAILRQFLIEAVVLCMMGCMIGIFLSWCVLRAAAIVVSSLSLTFKMDASVVLIAVGFCFMIGLVFGLYPANKAAKMKPIDALHYGG